MSGNPFNFSMGAGGGIPMGRARYSPRRPRVRVNSSVKKNIKQVRKRRERIARDVGEKRSMASVDKFIKKEGRWPTMNEADRFAQTEYLKGMDSFYGYGFKGITPAQRAALFRGRYSKGKQ
jgi:hypothetical protein